MTTIDAVLSRIAASKGDVHGQAALAADFLLSTRPEIERDPLRNALDAAAVLHWFEPMLLAKVLDIPAEEARGRLEMLIRLPFVERYRSTEGDLFNVHESTRLGWRKKLAAAEPHRFRALSLRAAACFADDHSPIGGIEWVYHLLGGDPDEGATALERLDQAWSSSARPEDRSALAAILRELEETQLVAGRARAWVLLVAAWARHERGETAQLLPSAELALRLARESGDGAAEADAHCLLGDVLQAQGKLEAAQAAFGEGLAICCRLVGQDPSNAGWQRELAVAHSRMGDVLQAQGKLEAAHVAFAEDLAISRRLAEQDPGNARWPRDLAVAHSRVGDVLQAQGKGEAAQTAFAEYLAISRRLAEQDPTNADWQRELAVAHGKGGEVLLAQGKREAAQAAFAEGLAICRRLADQDPSNTGWQRDLAVAHSRVGHVLQAQGKGEAAQTAFAEALAISRRLAAQDPSNAHWQRGLALACVLVAGLEARANRPHSALPLYDEAFRIFTALVEQAPGFAQWAEEKDIVESERALCRARVSATPSKNP